jgi:hypothetical protein
VATGGTGFVASGGMAGGCLLARKLGGPGLAEVTSETRGTLGGPGFFHGIGDPFEAFERFDPDTAGLTGTLNDTCGILRESGVVATIGGGAGRRFGGGGGAAIFGLGGTSSR